MAKNQDRPEREPEYERDFTRYSRVNDQNRVPYGSVRPTMENERSAYRKKNAKINFKKDIKEAEDITNSKEVSVDSSGFRKEALAGRNLTDADLSSTNNAVTVKPIGGSSGIMEGILRNSTKANFAMQKAMMNLQTKLSDRNYSVMQNIGKGINDISTFQRTIQAKYYEASINYKKDILGELKNISSIMKVGFNIKDAGNGKYERNSDVGGNSLLEQLFSGKKGAITNTLMQAGKQTVLKRTTGGAYSDISDMVQMMLPLMQGMNGKSLLKMSAGMVGSGILKKYVGHRQGTEMLDWMSNPQSMFEKFARGKSFGSSNKFIKDFFGMFAEEQEDRSLKSFNLKDYMKKDNRERATFDNKAHKSLTDVIPMYLANIDDRLEKMNKANNVTGFDPRYWDYDSNSAKRLSKVTRQFRGNTGENWKKAEKRVRSELEGEYSILNTILEEAEKTQSNKMKDLLKKPHVRTILSQGLFALWSYFAKEGIEEPWDYIRHANPEALAQHGVFGGIPYEDQIRTGEIVLRFFDVAKTMKGKDATYYIQSLIEDAPRELYNAFKKDTEDMIKNADNVGTTALFGGYRSRTNGKPIKNKRGKSTGRYTRGRYNAWGDGNEYYDVNASTRVSNSKNLYNASSVDLPDDEDKLTKDVAWMIDPIYYRLVTAELKLKEEYNGTDPNDLYTRSVKEKMYNLAKKARKEYAAKTKITEETIDNMTKRYRANGNKRMSRSFEATGDIMQDISSFQKFASEYISTTRGSREAKFALTAGSGVAIYKVMKSMGGGKYMSPFLGVMGAGALAMSGKMNGLIDVLGENGDIVMDNGKTRRENLMYKVMQDILPAGFAAKTGIGMSKFIKNHMRFGGIIGPILGTITGTALFALGKSGLFKGLVKGLTALPRFIFKKVFGQQAYDDAGKWINEKTGGFFDGSTPSYAEIFSKTEATKDGPTAKREAINMIQYYMECEQRYIKGVIWQIRGFDDNGHPVGDRDTTELDPLFVRRTVEMYKRSNATIDTLRDAYKVYIDAINLIDDKSPRAAREVSEIVERCLNDRDLITKMGRLTNYQKHAGHYAGDRNAVRDQDGRRIRYSIDTNARDFRDYGFREHATDDIDEKYASNKGRLDRDLEEYNNTQREKFEDIQRELDKNPSGTGGASADRRSQGNSKKKFKSGKRLDQIGCAVFVMAHLFSDVNGIKTDPEDIMDLAEPYIIGNGIHLRFFEEVASRHGIPFVTNSLKNTSTKKLVEFMKAGKNNVHIVLLSKRKGHGHFIYIKNVTDKECYVYDPLNPSRKKMAIGSVLTQATHVITYGEEHGDVKNLKVTDTALTLSTGSGVEDAIGGAPNGRAVQRSFYAHKGRTQTATQKKSSDIPLAVTIVGGHLDALGTVGSIDMDSYTENMRQIGSNTKVNKAYREHARDAYGNKDKNKWNKLNTSEQDKQERREEQNTESLTAIASGLGVDPKDKKKDDKKKKGGLLGSLLGGGLGLGALLAKLLGGGVKGGFNLLGNGLKFLFERHGSKRGLKDRFTDTFFKNPLRGAEQIDGQFGGFGKKGMGKLSDIFFGTDDVTKTRTATRYVLDNQKATNGLYSGMSSEAHKKLMRYAKEGVNTQFSKKVTEDVTETVAGKKGIFNKFGDVIKKMSSKISKIVGENGWLGGIMKKFGLKPKHIEQAVEKGAKEVAEKAAKSGTEVVGKKGLKHILGSMGTWLGGLTAGVSLLIPAAIIISDAWGGWNKAPLWMNTKTPTKLQKFCCALAAGVVSFFGNTGAPSIAIQTFTAFLEASDGAMAILANGIYGAINAFVKQTPGSGKNDATAGDNARYMEVDDGKGGTVIKEARDGSILEKGFGEFASDTMSTAAKGAMDVVAPGAQTVGEGLVMVLGNLAQVLASLVGGTVNGVANGIDTVSSWNAVPAGSGSGLAGRGDTASGKENPSNGSNSRTASGLLFVSQKRFMNNRLLGGESLTSNGCAISAMKMIASHVGINVSDTQLIETARKYIDKTNNGVKADYFTSFGGQMVTDGLMVKNNLSQGNGKGAVFLIRKGQGLHYVVVLTTRNKMYYGDPESTDFVPITAEHPVFSNFMYCIMFSSSPIRSIINGFKKFSNIGKGKGRFVGAGRGPSDGVKTLGFKNDMSKIIQGANASGIRNNSLGNRDKNGKTGNSWDVPQGATINIGGATAGDGAVTGGNVSGDALFRKIRQQQTLNEGSYTVDAGGPTMFGVIQKNARELMGYTGDMKQFPWEMADRYWHDHWFKNANILDFKNWKVGFATMDLMGANPSIGTDTLIEKAKNMGVTMPAKTTGGIGLKAPSKELIAEINKLPEDKAEQLALNIQDKWYTMTSGGSHPKGYTNRANYNKNFIKTGIAGGLATDGKPGTFEWNGVKYGADGPVTGGRGSFLGGRGSESVAERQGREHLNDEPLVWGRGSVGYTEEHLKRIHTSSKFVGSALGWADPNRTCGLAVGLMLLKTVYASMWQKFTPHAIKTWGEKTKGAFDKDYGVSQRFFMKLGLTPINIQQLVRSSGDGDTDEKGTWIYLRELLFGKNRMDSGELIVCNTGGHWIMVCRKRDATSGKNSNTDNYFIINNPDKPKAECGPLSILGSARATVVYYALALRDPAKLVNILNGASTPIASMDKGGTKNGQIVENGSPESAGADGGTGAGATGGGTQIETPQANLRGRFVSKSGKKFTFAGALSKYLKKIGNTIINVAGGGGAVPSANTGGSGSYTSSETGLSSSNDMVPGLPVENGVDNFSKNTPGVKVAEYIKSHVGTTGKSSCGAAVGNGIEGVFGNGKLRRPRHASSWFGAKILKPGDAANAQMINVEVMKSLGYKMISCASKPQVGDIIAYNDASRPAWYGHVCCLTSDGWYSYFKQNSFYVYNKRGPKENCKYTLWRYNEGAGDGEDEVNNKDKAKDTAKVTNNDAENKGIEDNSDSSATTTSSTDTSSQAQSGGGDGSGVTFKGRGRFISKSGKTFTFLGVVEKYLKRKFNSTHNTINISGGGSTGADPNGGVGAPGGPTVGGGTEAIAPGCPDARSGLPTVDPVPLGPNDKPYKAAKYIISKSIGPTSASACGIAVGNACIAAGYPDGMASNAPDKPNYKKIKAGSLPWKTGNYSGKPEKFGFTAISLASKPQPGDIMIIWPHGKINGGAASNSGHVCMYVGKALGAGGDGQAGWVSDFTQAHFSGSRSNSSPANYTKFKIMVFRDSNYCGKRGSGDVTGPTDSTTSKANVSTPSTVSLAPNSVQETKTNTMSYETAKFLSGDASSVKDSNNQNRFTPTATNSTVTGDKVTDPQLAVLTDVRGLLDELNNNLVKNVNLQMDIKNTNKAQLNLLTGIKENTGKRYIINGNGQIKTITKDGKYEDKFAKLKSKLDEWTKNTYEDYKIDPIPT